MFFDQYEMLCRTASKSPNGVAKELGIPSASVTQWKHGSTPRDDTVELICNYFHVTRGYIMGFTPEAQIDVTKYQIEKLTKKWPKTKPDQRYELECEIDRLQETLLDLQFIQNIEISKTQTQKNTRPTETGRAGSKYVKSIYEFVDRCGDDQLANLAQYVEFLKSQEKNKNT